MCQPLSLICNTTAAKKHHLLKLFIGQQDYRIQQGEELEPEQHGTRSQFSSNASSVNVVLTFSKSLIAFIPSIPMQFAVHIQLYFIAFCINISTNRQVLGQSKKNCSSTTRRSFLPHSLQCSCLVITHFVFL